MYKSTVGLLLSKFFSILAVFSSNIYFARMLGVDNYGKYSLLISGVTLAATFAVLGLPLYVTREIARLDAKKNIGILISLVRESYVAVFSGILVVIVILFFLLHFKVIDNDEKISTFLLMFFFITVFSFNLLRASILRGLHHVIIADIPDLIFKPFFIFICLTLLYFGFSKELKVSEAVLIQLVATILSFFLGVYYLSKKMPSNTSNQHFLLRYKWLKEVSPFYFLTILNLIQGQIGLYVLGYYSGTFQVGLFQVATQLVAIIIIGLSSVNLSLQPRLSAAWEMRDYNEINKLTKLSVKLGVIIAILLSSALLFFSDFFIGLFGGQYGASKEILNVLVIGQVVNALFGSCGVLMIAIGSQKKLLEFTFISVAISIVLMLSLVSAFQGVGVSYGVVFYYFFINILMSFYVYKKIKINTSIFQLLKR